MREHPSHFFFAIVNPLIAMVVDIGIEGRRYRASGFDAPQQIRVYERAVFNAVSRIGSWP